MSCLNDEILLHAPHANSHKHSHSHADCAHSHASATTNKKMLKLSIIITTIAMIFQLIYSILTNSLALLSDTLHMFSHVFALSLSFIAIWLSGRYGGEQRTFGFYRAEVIAAFINALMIVFFVFFIIYEAIEKLINPAQIDALTLIIVAIIGLIVNCATGILLLRADMENINIKSSFLHMMGDLLSSIGVIIGGVIVYYSGAVWVDTLLAFVIAFVIGKWSYSLIKSSLEILLESSPMPVESVRELLVSHPLVKDAHDIHISQITHNMYVLTAHIVILRDDALKFQQISRELSHLMLERVNIGHCTFAPEWREIWRARDARAVKFRAFG